jgi:subtilisin family serine protease
MGVKVLTSAGYGSAESIAAGIIFAADHGASIINMSLGSATNSGTIAAAVDYAIRKNVVVVAASGNSLTPPCSVNYPAALNKVIAVGATDSSDALASFSCTGPELDLVAPGKSILSTTLGGTSSLDGTSFASPIVAGVAALMRSVNTTMSVSDLTRALDFTTTDLGGSGFDNNFGFGKVNAYAAVVAAQNATKFTSNPGFSDKTFPYPNPFNVNQSAKVIIALPASLGSSGIKIDIRTVAGVTVKTLNGTNEWDGKNDDGNIVASGLYYYFAQTSQGEVKGKLTVIK